MGGLSSLPLSFFFFTLLNPFLLSYAQQQTPPPTFPPYNAAATSSTPFKPAIAVVVAVLTTIFSLTFLLLLYIKHCNGVNIHARGNSTSLPPFSGRKNSGIDRCVVESLPIFRFESLVGQKEGLDCAVCLTKFEAAEVLRLLPKCKHAFHVECVDTWLDAHSTCPLCRYRVDPEDILLVDNPNSNQRECVVDLERGRISWQSNEIAESKRRHSSVGERGGYESERKKTASFRMSVDSATSARKKKDSVGGIGCFVRGRKDGMLLTEERRLEHRIIVSPCGVINSGVQQFPHQRWSDVHASDLLYLTSEMIMREGRGRYTRGGERQKKKKKVEEGSCNDDEEVEVVGGVINSRSVSEITGLSRFSSRENNINENRGRGREYYDRNEEEQGLVSRWLAWISKTHSQAAVR